MSTTIDIFPVETLDISFGQVLELSQKNLNAFLKSIDINKEVVLEVNLYRNHGEKIDFQMTDKFEWKDDNTYEDEESNEYVLFTIKGIVAVAEAYMETIYQNGCMDPWWQLEDIIKSKNKIANLTSKVEKIKQLNKKWHLRCQWSNPTIMYVSCGLISAAIAELTSGILYSYDGAWEINAFPAESKAFLDFYYQKEKAKSSEYYERALHSYDAIVEELQELPDKPL